MSQMNDEFWEHGEFLTGLPWDNDGASIADMLDWLESDLETKAMLDAFRNKVPAESLVRGMHGFRLPPRVSNPDEARIFGLFLTEQYKKTNTNLLWVLAAQFNVSPPHLSSQPQDYTDAAMEQFIEAFLDYVEAELLKKDGNFSVEKATELFAANILGDAFRIKFTRTHEAINSISAFCGAPHSDEAWLAVRIMCREALDSYVSELRAKNLIDPAWEFKAGDTKGLFKQMTRTVDTSGTFGSTLVALVASVWDRAQSILHRQPTTKEQALRAFMWTGLTIAEIDGLIRLQP